MRGPNRRSAVSLAPMARVGALALSNTPPCEVLWGAGGVWARGPPQLGKLRRWGALAHAARHRPAPDAWALGVGIPVTSLGGADRSFGRAICRPRLIASLRLGGAVAERVPLCDSSVRLPLRPCPISPLRLRGGDAQSALVVVEAFLGSGGGIGRLVPCRLFQVAKAGGLICLGPRGPRHYPLSSFARCKVKNDADPHEVMSLSFFIETQRACERRASR